MSQLWHRVLGRAEPTQPILVPPGTFPPEDDWERAQRKAREAALEEEYRLRLQRVEDEYHLISRGQQREEEDHS